MSDHDISAVIDEVGSDPCRNWEEDAGIDVDLDLNITPRSSQELLNSMLREEEEMEVSMLHELEWEEATYSEHYDFLEGAFIFPVESGELDDSMCEIMDVVRHRPRKSEELSDIVMSFIANPKTRTILKCVVDAKTSMQNDAKERKISH